MNTGRYLRKQLNGGVTFPGPILSVASNDTAKVKLSRQPGFNSRIKMGEHTITFWTAPLPKMEGVVEIGADVLATVQNLKTYINAHPEIGVTAEGDGEELTLRLIPRKN